MKTLFFTFVFLFSIHRVYTQISHPDTRTAAPIVPDRPGQTNPPNIIPVGIFQLESGFLRESKTADGIQTTHFLYNTSLVRVGVSDNCELRLIVEYAGNRIDSTSRTISLNGFNPISLGTKLSVCPENKFVPQTAVNVAVTLPYFGKEEFRPTYLAPSLFLLMQKTLNSRLSLGCNLGLQWDGEQPNATAAYSVALSINLREDFSVYGEAYGFSTEQSSSEYHADIGCAYLVNNTLQVDLSIGAGLNNAAPDSFVAFGLAWKFGKE